jgi:hypothetical protein
MTWATMLLLLLERTKTLLSKSGSKLKSRQMLLEGHLPGHTS